MGNILEVFTRGPLVFSSFGLCFITGCFFSRLRGEAWSGEGLVLGLIEFWVKVEAWRPPFPLFIVFLGVRRCQPHLGGSVTWWGSAVQGGEGKGSVPVPGTSEEIVYEPDPCLGAGAASSWSIQLLGHPDVGAPGVGHPCELQMWHILGIWGCCHPCFPFVLGPDVCGAKPVPPDSGIQMRQLGICGVLGGAEWLYAGLK